jgi:hypothetical protein
MTERERSAVSSPLSTHGYIVSRRVKYWMCCVLALCCIRGLVLPAHISGAQAGTGPATSSATASPQTPRATQAVLPQQRDLEAGKQEYEQSSHDEAARLTYVTKLARIADPLVAEYRQSGRRHDEAMTVINSEWKKHPAPRDIDSKKLRQLLVGKWDSPLATSHVCLSCRWEMRSRRWSDIG